MAIYISSGAFQSRLLTDILAQARGLGVTHLELSSGVEHFPMLEEYVPTLKATGLSLLVHNYFPAPSIPFVLNLGALEPDALSASREHVRACLRLSRALGGAYYSVHSAFGLQLTADVLGKPELQAVLSARRGVPDRDHVRAVFVESLRLLCAEAATLGLDLLLENNVISPRYLSMRGVNPFLMTTADEIGSVLAEVSAPNLGLLLDVAHARVSATALGFDPVEFVQQVRPHVRALHLSDNDTVEDQNLPLREESWFWPHLKGMEHMDVVVEVYAIDGPNIMAQLKLARSRLES